MSIETWGICRMKDEVDVVEGVVRHHARQCDHVLVADNLSTDGTREKLAELERDVENVHVIDDDVVAYRQGERMTHIASLAYERGARWIVPFDADEIWFHHKGLLKELLAAHPTTRVAVAKMRNHFATTTDDPDEVDPFRRMQWCQPLPQELPKVAIQWGPGCLVHQGNHNATVPGDRWGHVDLGIEIRHFPMRSLEQFVSKVRNGAAAYAAAPELPIDYGGHWRRYGEVLDRDGEPGIKEIWEAHFLYDDPSAQGLVRSPAPYWPL